MSSGDNIKKLTLPDGFQVGIKNLDGIMKDVAGLELTDAEAVKTELLARVKACNFVASGAETDYASALLDEYRHRYEKAHKREKHGKPHAG